MFISVSAELLTDWDLFYLFTSEIEFSKLRTGKACLHFQSKQPMGKLLWPYVIVTQTMHNTYSDT